MSSHGIVYYIGNNGRADIGGVGGAGGGRGAEGAGRAGGARGGGVGTEKRSNIRCRSSSRSVIPPGGIITEWISVVTVTVYLGLQFVTYLGKKFFGTI